MIKSIYVAKTADNEIEDYVQNEVCLTEENSIAVRNMTIGELVQVEMRVVGIKEEVGEDGKTKRRATLAIPRDGDKSETTAPVGDEARKMYP
jgi:hypothetical protein